MVDRQDDILVTPTELWRPRESVVYQLPLPSPFRVKLDPAITHVWAGVVDEPGHPFNGQTVYLSQRGLAGKVYVEISPTSQDEFFSGYGRIEPRPARPPLSGAPVEPGVFKTQPPAPHERLIALWARPEHDYRRVVTHGEREIASLEAHYGVRLPADFRDYLLHACSTLDDGGEMDDFYIAWWGLERIRSVIEEYDWPLSDPALAAESAKALFFADAVMWCWAWAICCGDGPNYGRVFLVSSPDRFVADSFAEFVDLYMTDHKSLC